jgi:hypothetical protein
MSEEARSISILYKRRGHFDSQRDALLRRFQQTEKHEQLLAAVKDIVTAIVSKNPDLLLKNKGQLAALVEGVISRNSGLSAVGEEDASADVEVDVYELFDEEVKQSTIGSQDLRESIRQTLRLIREDQEQPTAASDVS